MPTKHCYVCFHEEEKKETLDSLKTQFDSIKQDIFNIGLMDLSNQSKAICKKELYTRLNEIKIKMHEIIEKM